jgi:hypothetical protein
MTPDILSALRHVLTALGGFAIGKGWIESQALEPIVGGLLVLAAAVWSAYERRKEPK